jgi:hypothetical protein
MRAKIKGIEVEGEPEELAKLLAALPESLATRHNVTSSSRASATVTRDKVPSIDQIKEYIKSKPDYKHRWDDLQRHFLGTTLTTSGKTKDAYRFFNNRLVLARRQIQEQEHGKFENEEGQLKFVKN